MKIIKAICGTGILVDDEDFEWANYFRWSIIGKGTHTLYAISSFYYKGNKTCFSIHRTIMGCEKKLPIVDHIDGNGLNNQRSNLRLCTYSQNAANTIKKSKSKSKYKGVNFSSKNQLKPWKAQLTSNYKIYDLGDYETEVLAAAAYDNKSYELNGEFAKLNFSKNPNSSVFRPAKLISDSYYYNSLAI